MSDLRDELARVLHDAMCCDGEYPCKEPVDTPYTTLADAILASGLVVPAEHAQTLRDSLRRAADSRDRLAAQVTAFRVAAELTVQDVRAQRGDHIASLVEDSFAAHFARALTDDQAQPTEETWCPQTNRCCDFHKYVADGCCCHEEEQP